MHILDLSFCARIQFLLIEGSSLRHLMADSLLMTTSIGVVCDGEAAGDIFAVGPGLIQANILVTASAIPAEADA